MPLISTEPTEIELPDLKLVGACTFCNFFADSQKNLFADTWERSCHQPIPNEKRANPNRSFALELYPPDFQKDRRWYYMACVEVKDLNETYPSSFVSRFIPAARYLKFTVQGPVTEVGPAFRTIYDELLPNSGRKIARYYDLEHYDERFKGPCDDSSQMDILIPLA
jgi:AraC family transcriptional regulator